MAEEISLKNLTRRFLSATEQWEAVIKIELRRVGRKVRDDATAKFGHYQPAVGPYPAWAPLAPSTLANKLPHAGETRRGGLFSPIGHTGTFYAIESGNTFDDPLIGHYAKGRGNKVWPAHLRNTISEQLNGLKVYIGTDDPLGPIHEFGSTNGKHPIPPRPFLRPAAFQNEDFFRKRMEWAFELATIKALGG
jgi:hypothetical protein